MTRSRFVPLCLACVAAAVARGATTDDVRVDRPNVLWFKVEDISPDHGKSDDNWQAPKTTWDVQHRDWSANGWRRRATGQPFFTVVNITDTHSSQIYYRGDRKWNGQQSS